MKKIFFSILLLFGLLGAVTDESLDIKLNQEVRFGDGFGTITGYPQNISNELKDKIKFIGEYNLDKNTGNLLIRFTRLQYEGKIYELTEGFEKKLRLKKPETARLKNGAKILVSGGNKQEILDIVNQKKQALAKAESDKADSELGEDKKMSESPNLSLLGGSGNSSNDSNYPYYYGGNDSTPTTSTTDYSSATTQSDGTCKAPSINNGIVSVYTTSSSGGSCKLFTTSEESIYYKYNTAGCKNKPDYASGRIQLGREGFVALDDNKEYKVVSCQYTEPMELRSEIGTCKAIPKISLKKAEIQKQYYYIQENERVNVGGCTPTGEEVALQEDFESCTYRPDFTKGVAFKQVQLFYMQDNQKVKVGSCVDKEDDPQFQYSLFEDETTCDHKISDGVAYYESRLAFEGITGDKNFATECRIVRTDGYPIQEETSGYQYQDSQNQAQRKINQYVMMKTNAGIKKKIINSNVVTNKTYPYKKEVCRWEHNDNNKTSKKFFKITFFNDDDSIEVVRDECSTQIGVENIEYQNLGEERETTRTEQFRILQQEIQTGGETSWKIYDTSVYIVNNPITSRNVKESKVFRVNPRDVIGSHELPSPQAVENYINTHYIPSWKDEVYKKYGGDNITALKNATEYSATDNYWDSSLRNPSGFTGNITTKNGYATNQILQQTRIVDSYRRGDGTTYQENERFEWRAIENISSRAKRIFKKAM